MKTIISIFALILSAKYANAASCNPNGLEDKISSIIERDLRAQVISSMSQKGIQIAPNSLQLDVSVVITEPNTSYPDDSNQYVIIGATGRLASKSGTNFSLAFSSGDWTGNQYVGSYIANLLSDGFDRQGNPINGHCSISQNPNSDAGRITVKNESSNYKIETLALPNPIRIY